MNFILKAPAILYCLLIGLSGIMTPFAARAAEAAPSAAFTLLWPDGAPGAQGSLAEDRPGFYTFLPPAEKASGTAIVICPGGGYRSLALTYEGESVAHWLNGQGITAYVLQYRHAPRYHYPVPLQDLERALMLVREQNRHYGAGRVGVLGFSAGGHLAALAVTRFTGGARPDFAILAYPLITMLPPYTNEEAVANFLGKDTSRARREAVSAEQLVTAATPPVFLFQTGEDNVVNPENGILFYRALRQAGVSAELHLFARGGHGVGLADGQQGTPNIPALNLWAQMALNWLNGLKTPGRH